MSTTLLSRVREVLSLPTEVYNERGQKWLRVESSFDRNDIENHKQTLFDLRQAFEYCGGDWLNRSVFIVHNVRGKVLGEVRVYMTDIGHTIIYLIPQ